MYSDRAAVGRNQAPDSTLAGLDDALASLERRMSKLAASRPKPPAPPVPDRRPADRFANDLADIVRHQRALERETAMRSRLPHSPARETSALRADYSPRPTAGPLPQREARKAPAPAVQPYPDLSSLPETLSREMGEMRAEIARLRETAANAADPRIAQGLERVSRDVARLAASPRTDDYAAVRGEIAQLRGAVERMAREDSIQELTERWQVLERYMGEHGEVLHTSTAQTGERLSQLADHVNAIRDAVSAFPEADVLSGIEARIGSLSTAIERVADRREAISPEAIYQIEERLDEISRALIAVSVSNTPTTIDTTPFERIEARIGALARQIEDVAAERGDTALAERIEDRISGLARQIDQIGGGSSLEAAERIESRILDLASRMDDLAGDRNSTDRHTRLESLIAELGTQIDGIAAHAADDTTTDRLAAVIMDLVERIDALGSAPVHDDAVMARIETLVADLRDQISAIGDETGVEAGLGRIEGRISDLAARMETVAGANAIGGFAGDLGEIHERLDAIADGVSRSDPNLLRIVERLNELADRIDSQPVGLMGGSPALSDDLGSRFEELSALIDARTNRSAAATERMARALTEKIEELAQRIDAGSGSADLEHIDRRLDAIASRLDTRPAAADTPVGLLQIEEQIASIADYLRDLPREAGMGGALDGRLAAIENHLLDERDRLVEAACQAARDAIASQGLTGAPAGPGLGEDLRQLEDIARAADQRNANTFGAIHDTLLKVVEKLAGIEARIANGDGDMLAATQRTPAAAKQSVAAAPSIDIGDDPLVADAIALNEQLERAPRSPAEAAAAAARAAVESPDRTSRRMSAKPKQKPSMLGGLTRALRLGKSEPAPKAPPHRMRTEPAASMAADVASADSDMPLEPGSGAPDLSQIMRRVREEKRQSDKPAESENSKEDFIAAARRAAQAAAAEAAILKSDPKGKKRTGAPNSRIGALFSGNRKMLAIGAGAVILAVLAVPAVMSMFSGQPAPMQVAAVDGGDVAMEPAAEQQDVPVETVSVDENGDPAVAEASTAGLMTATAPQAELPPVVAGVPASGDAVDPAPAPLAAAAPAEIPAVPVAAGPVALREAAAKGDPVAMFAIADRYTEGTGVTSDFKEAAKWYRLSADAGYAPAQYRLGTFYEKGFGVDQSVPEAKTWYQLAAEQGNANAMHNLAVLHAMGIEGAPDNESAAIWFRKAADLGVKDSQYNLAILTAKGLGTPQDLGESYKWFALAAKAGDPDAATKRDEVAKAMQPAQLDTARAAADLWKAQPLVEAANAPVIPPEWTESREQTAAVDPGIDMKKATRNIQLILNKAGFDAGSADGVMGEKTRQAIRAFQKSTGMTETGEVDQALVDALLKLNNG